MRAMPSPERQLAFLGKLQRLFAEGDFSATYKYALLIALADLAVELGSDDDAELPLTHGAIAAKFIELYWQQAAPYSNGHNSIAAGILQQNNGTQAAIITAILEFRSGNSAVSVQAASSLEGFKVLLRSVAQTVSAQPIKYLQNLGGQADPFLYRREPSAVVLLPGVAFCLRRFQPLVQQLARSHWVHHIKRNRLNLALLGEVDDLESFLFMTPRQALVLIGASLMRLTGKHCFYCRLPMQVADVDHFVPFSMYPRDLMHNFVLAHPGCNRSKSDTLAARPHLERWIEFVNKNDDALREIGAASGRVSDLGSCRAVTRWGYTNAQTSGGRAWLRAGTYETVDAAYLECLA